MWETWLWSLGWEKSLGTGHGNPLQYSCLEYPMDRGAWRAIVHGVSESQTQLSDWAQHSTWDSAQRTHMPSHFVWVIAVAATLCMLQLPYPDSKVTCVCIVKSRNWISVETDDFRWKRGRSHRFKASMNGRKPLTETEMLGGTSWNCPQECYFFGYLIWRDDSLEKTLMLGKTESRRRRGWQGMKWLDGITNLMDMSLSKLQELDTTERLNWLKTGIGTAPNTIVMRLNNDIHKCLWPS